jgi:hypothetical protein
VATIFTWIDTEGRYRPKLGAGTTYAETSEEYCERMNELLPRFPAPVLTQWFYEHWGDIDRYAWLNYGRLGFQKVSWTTTAVMSSGLRENHSVQVDMRHFEEGVTNPRIERIAAHFKAHGTWPVPPVLLANPDADVVRPDGFRLTSPYHLLEGHHRAGLFCSFFGRGVLGPDHEVWVATLTDA